MDNRARANGIALVVGAIVFLLSWVLIATAFAALLLLLPPQFTYGANVVGGGSGLVVGLVLAWLAFTASKRRMMTVR